MRRDYILEVVNSITADPAISEAIVERLEQEDLLNLHYGDQDVGKIIEVFKNSFHTTRTSKWDRFAAKRLANKHSVEAVCQIIQLLDQRQDYKYVPVINSISQLEDKWVNVIKFLRKSKPVEVEL